MRKKRAKIPSYIIEAQVFSSVYKILNEINKGEVTEAIDELGSRVVMPVLPTPEHKNTIFPAVAYIKHWCAVWDIVARNMNVDLSSSSLLEVADRLSETELIFEESIIAKAKLEVDAQRVLWRKVPEDIMEKSLLEA